MTLCHKHPHSSDDSARRCYAKTMRSRASKKQRGYAPPPPPYRWFSPPVLVPGRVPVFVWGGRL